jgi:FdhE protein
MSTENIERLRHLARTDASVAPLARLQIEVQRAVSDRAWQDAVPTLERGRLEAGQPLLHDVTIALPLDRFSALLARLAGSAEEGRAPELRGLRGRLAGVRLDVAALAEAAIAQDHERLNVLASAAGIDIALLDTLAQMAVTPLLLAVGGRAAPLVEDGGWDVGYCPVCAAWPVLAELRGLEQRRWPRCSRCSTGWQRSGFACLYCENADFDTLGYLAPESDRESRRAATCDRCHGYLKTLTTLGPLAPLDVTLADATTLELDVAALERGYGRPETAGLPLRVAVTEAGRGGLLGLRR